MALIGGLPSGTVTFLFTDIEGSTPLWDEHPAAMREALALHDEILRKQIDRCDGHIFSTGGDGVAAVFGRATDGVAAAINAQVSLLAAAWPEPIELRVRMGLHTGEVQERDGDYLGPAVNRAARLMDVANGGQVIVSSVTASLVDSSDDFEFVDLGDVQLKGVVAPVHAFGVVAEGLPASGVRVSLQANVGNLPRPGTEFIGNLIGYRRTIAELRGAQLVTLTGSGGVGKTRSAIETGWMVLDEFADGVWIVELAPIADPEAVVPAIASVFSIQTQPGMTTRDAVVAWCRDRRMMLILDNCEHVLDAAGDIVGDIVAACPTVTIVATSREPLGVPGEQVIRIPSLDRHHSVELFCDRAVSADSSFDPAGVDLDVVGAICDRVDGIPLAIELAAARIRSLHPSELLERLDDRFRLLRGGGRGGLERHQTLRATVSWSYQLLDEAEQLLFDRLSVFAGTFDLGAVESVCGDDRLDELDIIDLIGELVDKSMVIAERGEARTRYHLLETLRQFGEERLDDRGETALMRDRHLAYFESLGRRLYDRQWSPEELEALAVFGLEWDNFRAAHHWSVVSSDLERSNSLVEATMFSALARLHLDQVDWAERTIRLGEELGRPDPRCIVVAGFWRFVGGDAERALAHGRRALDLDDGDAEVEATSRALIVYALLIGGRFDEVPAELPALGALLDGPIDDAATAIIGRMALVDASLGQPEFGPAVNRLAELVRRIGARTFESTVLRYEAIDAYLSNPPDLERADDLCRQAIAVADEAGNQEQACWARGNLAMMHRHSASLAGVETLIEALEYALDRRHNLAMLSALELVPGVLIRKGDEEGAYTVAGRVELAPPAFWMSTVLRDETARVFEESSGQMSTERNRFAAAGASMDLHAVVGYALGRLRELVSAPS